MNELDPQVSAELDAIDAALAGDPIDPEHAEPAELALLLVQERPEPSDVFVRNLDERLAAGGPARAPRRRWWPTVAASAAGLAAAAAAVVVVAAGGSGSSSFSSSTASPVTRAPAAASSATPRAQGVAPNSGVPGAASSNGSPATPVIPPSPGRKLVQSAQLSLTTQPARIDQVAGEVLRVVQAENGIVDSSSITQTGGTDGNAQLALSVPGAALGETMGRLSQLPYARVASRTDNAQDITDQWTAATHRLADDRALRTALLKQLANASSPQQIASLKAQINDAEASIASDQATVNRLSKQINYSSIEVTIGAGQSPIAPGGGFTIGRAAHDAGRVLTVAAGVMLIVAAALVPAALIVALWWWIASLLRRRRREQALDMA